jgi:hypothetical protein
MAACYKTYVGKRTSSVDSAIETAGPVIDSISSAFTLITETEPVSETVYEWGWQIFGFVKETVNYRI